MCAREEVGWELAAPHLQKFEVRVLRGELGEHGVQVSAWLSPGCTHVHEDRALTDEGIRVREVTWR